MNKFTSSSSTLLKLSDTLPCLMEDKCEIQIVELEYDQTKLQLDGHMQYAHSPMEENTGQPCPCLAAQSLPSLAYLHTWLRPGPAPVVGHHATISHRGGAISGGVWSPLASSDPHHVPVDVSHVVRVPHHTVHPQSHWLNHGCNSLSGGTMTRKKIICLWSVNHANKK